MSKIFQAIIRFFLISLIAVLQKTGHQGTSLPGKILFKLAPNSLAYYRKNIKEKVIVITGTNGKTTTSNLIRHIFEKQGFSITSNKEGANMASGIYTTIMLSQGRTDYAVIEVDEASLPPLMAQLQPDILLIHNIFRDQLDRYGELDITLRYIVEAIQKNGKDDLLLVLNGDDPLIASIKVKQNKRFYGFNQTLFSHDINTEVKEGQFCPICNSPLNYNYYHYSQLGDYYCSCGFKRPALDVRGEISGGEIVIKLEEELKLNPPIEGFYNYYNILASVAITSLFVQPAKITQAISDFKPVAGRMEYFRKKNLEVVLVLVKNPIGMNQVLEVIRNKEDIESITFIINDLAADGRDISWLWDVNFEKLLGKNIANYYTTGLRKEDMALRLKYAGLKEENIKIAENLKEVLASAEKKGTNSLWVLATYTALYDNQHILKEWENND